MPPPEMDAVLEKLPLRVGAYVPSDLLEDWFAPGTGMNPVSDAIIEAATAYGRKFECEFKYYPERMEGVFWKMGSGDLETGKEPTCSRRRSGTRSSTS